MRNSYSEYAEPRFFTRPRNGEELRINVGTLNAFVGSKYDCSTITNSNLSSWQLDSL
jgi:hypothetical protein